MDGFTASQRVLPCRWSIIRIGYLAFLAAGCGHTECWKISGAAAPDFFSGVFGPHARLWERQHCAPSATGFVCFVGQWGDRNLLSC